MVLIPYIRQSRPGERDVSFEQQWDAVEAWARSNGAKMTVSSLDAAETDGLVERKTSGAKSWRERELGRILEACRRKQASGVIVFDQSRLTREDLLGTAEVWDALEKAKADLVDATGGGKVNRMQYVLKAEMNRQQWEQARDRGNDTRRRHVDAGIHGGAKVPFGYRRGDDRVFVIDERQGRGGALLLPLPRLGTCPGTHSPPRWTHVGPLDSAWTPQRLRPHDPQRTFTSGSRRSGEYVNREAHEPSSRASSGRPLRGTGSVESGSGAPRLLSGIARCATCGYALRKDYTRPDFARYACGGRKAKAVCSSPVTIGAERLDNYVTDLFLERLRSEPVCHRCHPCGRGARRGRAGELEEAEAELAAYMSTNLVSIIGPEAFEAGARQRADAVMARVRARRAPAPATRHPAHDGCA